MGDEELAAIDAATGGRRPRGRLVLHLQCHIGCDSIAMARMGATVTSVDFSRTALDRLEILAEECGVAIATIEADATRLPGALRPIRPRLHDDRRAVLDRRPRRLDGRGGPRAPSRRHLVLVELHPVVTMVESLDPLLVDFPYADDGPHVYTGTGTYANRDADIAWTTVQYAHSLGEVVTAAARAGLHVRLPRGAHVGLVQHRPVRGPRGRRALPAAAGRGCAPDGRPSPPARCRCSTRSSRRDSEPLSSRRASGVAAGSAGAPAGAPPRACVAGGVVCRRRARGPVRRSRRALTAPGPARAERPDGAVEVVGIEQQPRLPVGQQLGEPEHASPEDGEPVLIASITLRGRDSTSEPHTRTSPPGTTGAGPRRPARGARGRRARHGRGTLAAPTSSGCRGRPRARVSSG